MRDLAEVQRLFDLALEKAPEERAEFLTRACGGDRDLLKEVLELVRSDRESEGFLESGALEVEARNLANERSRLSGQRLGQYEVLEWLSEGGMGSVYKVRNHATARIEAIKVLPPELATDPTRVRRLAREAGSASTLQHPNIARVFGVHEEAGHHFLSMELVEGIPLSQLIQGQPIPLEQLLEIAIQIAEGLSEAHRRGIIHRDIKPSNIMLEPSGNAKILDFGLAKVQREFRSDLLFDMSSESLTSPGTVVGTIDYMSPEQILNRKVDQRCDIFSFGVLLYQMSTGRVPFKGSSLPDTLDRICNGQPPPIGVFSLEPSGRLEEIVRKCLRKEPSERFGSMRVLADRLRELKGSPQPRETRSRVRMIGVWLGLAIALLLILSWMVFGLTSR